MLRCEEKMTDLKKEKIIEITEGKKVFYGGNQKWFKNKVLQKVGCSIVAGANLIAYTALAEKNENLFPYKDSSKNNFVKLMNETAKYLKPDEEIGTISTLYFIQGMKKFFEDKHIKVDPQWITTEYEYEEFEKFIVNAVKEDKPVILMLLKNLKLSEFNWHWMTITRIFNCNDIVYVYVSTWGEKRVMRLYDLYLYSYYGSLICF